MPTLTSFFFESPGAVSTRLKQQSLQLTLQVSFAKSPLSFLVWVSSPASKNIYTVIVIYRNAGPWLVVMRSWKHVPCSFCNALYQCSSMLVFLSCCPTYCPTSYLGIHRGGTDPCHMKNWSVTCSNSEFFPLHLI